MTIVDLDHVNIRTAHGAALVRFYREVLGLEVGPRPPFSFQGTWLYCGSKAAIHLVEIDAPGAGGGISVIEHVAFTAEGLEAFLDRLRAADIAYELRTVPDWGIRQVHLRDPDGNHVEVAFAPEEGAGPAA